MENITIYNLPPAPPRWDRVGITYISLCATWTALVLAGAAFCWFNRHTPALRLRGIPLSLSAVLLLHCYWVLAQITYPVAVTMPVVLAYDIQYFFMGIYFPLGIALFQASNMRFLHVARMQRRYADRQLGRESSGTGVYDCNGSAHSWLCWLRNIDYTKKIMLFIGIGMVFQLFLTVGMWLACLKYHPTYGIPGTGIRSETVQEQIVELGRGWEWWPSVLWQVIWTWIVAPILLWRAWGIRDTMGWRMQTIGCCLSNLHATPMFLIATYVDAFAPINAYFHPSQWIHLSIMMFEVFTIFIPVYQVIRLRVLARRLANSTAGWGTDSQATLTRTLPTSDSAHSAQTSPMLAGKPRCSTSSSQFVECYLDPSLGDRLFTMAALDRVLTEHPEPLQDFSALSDFSGENIAFLTRTAVWKASLHPAFFLSPIMHQEVQIPGVMLPQLDMFNQALEIYLEFISPQHAAFPLNISSKALKHLQGIFGESAEAVRVTPEANPATPFETPALYNRASIEKYGAPTTSTVYTGSIPAGFSREVFDDVRDSVRYLVLTNTWPKFVTEMQRRHELGRRQRRSGDTERTEDSEASSQRTLVAKMSQTFRSVL